MASQRTKSASEVEALLHEALPPARANGRSAIVVGGHRGKSSAIEPAEQALISARLTDADREFEKSLKRKLPVRPHYRPLQSPFSHP